MINPEVLSSNKRTWNHYRGALLALLLAGTAFAGCASAQSNNSKNQPTIAANSSGGFTPPSTDAGEYTGVNALVAGDGDYLGSIIDGDNTEEFSVKISPSSNQEVYFDFACAGTTTQVMDTIFADGKAYTATSFCSSGQVVDSPLSLNPGSYKIKVIDNGGGVWAFGFTYVNPTTG